MKRINLTFVFLICFFTGLQAAFTQNSALDSLENVLKTHHQKDTIRLNTLNYLAFYNYRNNPPEAIKYIDEALTLAKELQIVKFLAQSHYIKVLFIPNKLILKQPLTIMKRLLNCIHL